MDQRTELSEFLRSRRARLQPSDVGLPDYGGRRRVPGLRREELAQLAGVSTAYYVRLEQGHGENVSEAVLDAIARALRLTHAEREHLRRITKPVRRRPGRGRPARPQPVRPEFQQLLDAMENVPAYVIGRRLDVIAWNRLGSALAGDFAALPPDHRNMAWQVFLDPAARELYLDWEGKAADVVGILRLDAGRDPDDPRLTSLIGELSSRAATSVASGQRTTSGRRATAPRSSTTPWSAGSRCATRRSARPGTRTRCWSPTTRIPARPRPSRSACWPVGPRPARPGSLRRPPSRRALSRRAPRGRTPPPRRGPRRPRTTGR